MELLESTVYQSKENNKIPFPEKPELPQWVLFGNEWIELDESMFTAGLCPECKELGYCKRDNRSQQKN